MDAVDAVDVALPPSALPDPSGPGVPVDVAGRWLGRAWHVLVVVLAVAGTLRATATDPGAGPWAAGAILLAMDAAWIATGTAPGFELTGTGARDRHSIVRWWDVVGMLAAASAVAAYPDAWVWLAFPAGLVMFHRLPIWQSLVVGAALTAGCLAALARVAPLTGPRILGPVIGLAVAAAGAIAIRSLQAEAQRRWQLVVELRVTRELVARREHEAGILEERARLARDIHDTVAQGLASILMLSTAIRRQLVDPPATVSEHLAQLDEVAREDLAATRRLIADLAPTDLDDLDLAEALARRAQRVQRASRVAVELDLDELPVLPRDVEVAVLRIVGQAMDNAVAHATPDRIRVTAATVGDRVVVDVHDDGTGFDPVAIEGGDDGMNLGITGMRARARALGGQLTIESHSGSGTVVAVELPIGGRRDHGAPTPPVHTPAPHTPPRTESA